MELGEWLVLVVATLIAIGGLFLASSASAGSSNSAIGFIIAAAAIGFGFYHIKRFFDRIDSGPR